MTAHRPNCTGANTYSKTNSIGVLWTHCRSCNVRWLGGPEPTVPTPPDVAPTVDPTPTATGYVCRDHHDQAVTWRGTGCKACQSEHNARRKTPVLDDDTSTRNAR